MNADKKELFDLCSSFFIRDDYSLWAIHLTGRRSRGSHVGRAPSPAAGPPGRRANRADEGVRRGPGGPPHQADQSDYLSQVDSA